MDPAKKSAAKCSNHVFSKGSLVLSLISILLIVALFLRMETINKQTDMNELRILAVESRTKMTSKADENVEEKPKTFTGVMRKQSVDYYKRKKRNSAPTAGTITLQQVRQEINRKFNEVCKSSEEAFSTLQVKEPPTFAKKPPSFVIVEEGSVLSLCCEAEGSPRPSVEWSHVYFPRLRWSPFRHVYSTSTSLAFQERGCLEFNPAKINSEGTYVCRARNLIGLAETTTEVVVKEKTVEHSCKDILKKGMLKHSGIYVLVAKNLRYTVYCDIGADRTAWTLIARFSNSDGKNWMRDDGKWWYDQQNNNGTTNDPSINADMISPAFWLVSGSEIKITRSDDLSHTPLLQTTGKCLGGQTFRSKISSYGDFRNGKVWANNQCLGSCSVQYGGQYKSTDGFQQAGCSGDIQSANKIGFWCDWDGGDGSVMMIGGGGKYCARADHGIGITETGDASFVEIGGRD